jgi:hypothetical protein
MEIQLRAPKGRLPPRLLVALPEPLGLGNTQPAAAKPARQVAGDPESSEPRGSSGLFAEIDRLAHAESVRIELEGELPRTDHLFVQREQFCLLAKAVFLLGGKARDDCV